MRTLILPTRIAIGFRLLGCVFMFFSLTAMGRYERRNEAPAVASNAVMQIPDSDDGWTMLAGTNEGLFSIDRRGALTQLWSGGSVRKLLFIPSHAGAADMWVILGNEGIFVSTDLEAWESRNQGLPVKTIKHFRDGSKSFLQIVQEIKDLEVNPANPDIMVCATKDRVYLSRDRGRSWSSMPGLPYIANGIKAVASAYMPGAQAGTDKDLTLFLSHSISAFTTSSRIAVMLSGSHLAKVLKSWKQQTMPMKLPTLPLPSTLRQGTQKSMPRKLFAGGFTGWIGITKISILSGRIPALLAQWTRS